MVKTAFRAFSLMLLVLLCCAAARAQGGKGGDEEIAVVRVTGDCIIVDESGRSFVLAGVAFPEVPVKERLARRERGFVRDGSVDFVRAALAGKRVRIVPVPEGGRGAVGVYLLPGGEFFNLEVLARGMALADSNSAIGASPEFAAAQEKAMLAGAGVWGEQADGSDTAKMGVDAIDNQARTVDFVSRYQGPAEESED